MEDSAVSHKLDEELGRISNLYQRKQALREELSMMPLQQY